MRLPILLAVLLLFVTGTVSAQPSTQARWIADPLTGCRVWSPLPEPNETIAWSGDCQNDVAQGRGTLQWFQNAILRGFSEGKWLDGKQKSGRGIYTFANGDRYEGEFVDAKFGGRGIATDTKGNRYEGDWLGGKKSGRGIYITPNGDRYNGEWRDGKANGWGIITYANGNRLEGEFRNNNQKGRGVLTKANGDRYEGDWLDGMLNGIGDVTYVNGNRYDGEFRNNKPNGRGIATFANGERFEGVFDGNGIGRGVYTYANGAQYAGEWRDNKFIRNAAGIAPTYRTEIQLLKKGGTFLVPVKVNGTLTLEFIIDSGATDVSIPADVAVTLMRLGTIQTSDFLGRQTYRLADGSVTPSETFRIRMLMVGDREVANVTGSISNELLLGQSFLGRFKSWSIDNHRNVLVLE